MEGDLQLSDLKCFEGFFFAMILFEKSLTTLPFSLFEQYEETGPTHFKSSDFELSQLIWNLTSGPHIPCGRNISLVIFIFRARLQWCIIQRIGEEPPVFFTACCMLSVCGRSYHHHRRRFTSVSVSISVQYIYRHENYTRNRCPIHSRHVAQP